MNLDRSTDSNCEHNSSNSITLSQKTPTIIEENELEMQSIPSSTSITKPNISVERLSMSKLNLISSHNEQAPKQQKSMENFAKSNR